MSFRINTVIGVVDNLPTDQIYRYLGAKTLEHDERLAERIRRLQPSFLNDLQCKGCYTIIPVKIIGDTVDLTVCSLHSHHLARNLLGCEYVGLFAATIGVEADRQRRRASVISSVDEMILDAMGSTAIEIFCDDICREISGQHFGYKQRPRFSPGYGDFPLDAQKTFLDILDARRKIGVSLSDGLLMVPQKSVTAIVGLGKSGCDAVRPDCENCEKSEREYRQ